MMFMFLLWLTRKGCAWSRGFPPGDVPGGDNPRRLELVFELHCPARFFHGARLRKQPLTAQSEAK